MAGPTKRRYALALAVLVVVALVSGLLISVPYVVADEAGFARGYSYGLSSEVAGEQRVRTIDAAAEVPGPTNQGRRRVQEFQKRVGFLQADLILIVLDYGTAEATACLVPGVSAKLQAQIDRAKFLALGFNPSLVTAPPERTEVFVPPGFKTDNNCVTPVDAVTDSRSGPPSPSPGQTGAPPPSPTGSPSPSPTPSPTPTGSPTGSPTGTPTRSPSPTPTRPRPTPTGPIVNCEVWTSLAAHGPTCLATLPLWNAEGFTYWDDTVIAVDALDIQADAVARCEKGEVEFGTGATFDGLLHFPVNTQRPNQQADIALGIPGGLITYWETNWDPLTDSTTDGSDTVYVNGAHIRSGVDNIIIAHAEATADCPPKPSPGVTTTAPTGPTFGPSPPPGGFPRDVNLESSKRRLIYGKTFTLTGAVTPATEFETPRRCVQNVAVTISRDVVGGAEDFVDVGTVRTDSDGHFSFNFTADRNAQWLAFVAKDEPVDCAESSSEPAPVLVRPRVNVRVDQKTPPRGGTFTFTARLIPCEGSHPGTKFKLRQQVQGRMVKIAGARSDANCTARFTRRANFDKAVFDVTWPKQDDDHQFAKSRARLIDSRGR